MHSNSENQVFEHSYPDLIFGDYTAFMEALTIHGMVSADFDRVKHEGKYIWNLSPITISTTKYPLLEGGDAGTMSIIGTKRDIETVHMLVNRYAICENKIPLNSIKVPLEYHKQLNPILWKDGHIKSDVYKQLMEIVDAYKQFLDMPGLDIEDIIITGSCANYNWNSDSDIDIHLVVDVAQTEQKFGKLVSQYFDSMRHQWNSLHDINIFGIPVEIYAQDIKEEHNSTGIYSIKNKKWVIEPKYDKPTINRSDVKKKAADYMKQIDKVCQSDNQQLIQQLFDKIKKMRQTDLEKHGEFSVGNLVFKTLRNNGYIEKLVSGKHKALDSELSLQEMLKNYNTEIL